MSKILITEEQLEILTEFVLINEQSSIGDIVVIDGKRVKIIDLIQRNLPKQNIGQKFASGTYQLSKDSKTKTEALLQKMIKFFKMAELQNTTFNVTLDGGASQVPLGDNLAKKLGINLSLDLFVGRNKELGKKRAQAIQKLLRDGLKSAGITNVTIPEPTVIVGKTKWDKNKGANHKDYTDEQFMNVSVEASGTKVVKEQLPDFCSTPFKPKKGTQASKNNGYKVYQGEGMDVDMGEGTGQITLKFDALDLPDMFEISYNGQIYRSKNPTTQEEGFVSAQFTKLTDEQMTSLEATTNKNKKSLADLEANIEKYGYERPVKVGRYVDKYIFKWFPLSDRVVKNYNWEEKGEMETYKLDANGEADIQWFEEFFKKFPTEKGFERFEVDGKKVRKSLGLKKEQARQLWRSVVQKQKSAQNKPKKVKQTMEKLRASITKTSVDLEYNKKYSGNYTAFIKEMDAKIKAAGFSESIVGPNGEITFNKVSGVNNMSLQVYAPIGGTVWNAKVGCKALAQTA
tara:strand:- start:3083 stop:4624 length:1542 start_codon:yes stop_codon:yes gene_type:complete